jgi:hypothetical protein
LDQRCDRAQTAGARSLQLETAALKVLGISKPKAVTTA